MPLMVRFCELVMPSVDDDPVSGLMPVMTGIYGA
jgi:hypothetical protein